MIGSPAEGPSLAPGAVVASRYEIRSRLGRGGMGVVYLAHDAVLEETVALKVLRAEVVAASPEMERRFLAEIKLARAVTHKNVCRIHEYGVDGALRYISMAYVDGSDLREFLGRHGAMAPHQAYEITIQVADALQAIHGEGIVHRDLKMANLMLDTRGVVRVMDFGIAKLSDEAADAGLTAAGHLIGTPEYMSPEQIRGEKLDGRSDIYALGVVAYELFAGRVPFRGHTPVATLMCHLQMPPPLEGPEADRLPPALVPILKKALSKERSARFATAGEMAAALRAAAAGVPTVPLPPPEAERETRSEAPPAEATVSSGAPRWVIPALLAALAVAVVAIAVGVAFVPRGREERAAGTAVPPPPTVADGVTAAAESTPRTPPQATMAAAPSPPPGSRPASARSDERPGPTPARPALAATAQLPSVPSSEVANSVAGLLIEAEAAVAQGQCSLALDFYAEALRLDPRNERARAGREICATAAEAAGPGAARTGRPFVTGQTRQAAEAVRRGPAGFESSAGVAARPVEQSTAPAGKVVFDVEPREVGPGDRFHLRVYLVNESPGALEVRQVTATTTVDGRSASGTLPTPPRPLPPGDKAMLLSVQERWKAEVTSWSLQVAVRVASGDLYTNEISWK